MCFDWVNDREVWRSIIAKVFWYGTKRKTFLRAGRCFFWIWSTLVSAWTKTQSLIPVSCISSLVDSTLYTHCVFSLAVAGSCISLLCRGTSCLFSVICALPVLLSGIYLNCLVSLMHEAAHVRLWVSTWTPGGSDHLLLCCNSISSTWHLLPCFLGLFSIVALVPDIWQNLQACQYVSGFLSLSYLLLSFHTSPFLKIDMDDLNCRVFFIILIHIDVLAASGFSLVWFFN